MKYRENRMSTYIAIYPEIEEFIRLVYQLDAMEQGTVASRLFGAIHRLNWRSPGLTERSLLSLSFKEKLFYDTRGVGPKIMSLFTEASRQYKAGVRAETLDIPKKDVSELEKLFLERLHLTPNTVMSDQQFQQAVTKGRRLGEEIVRRYCSV